MTYYFTVVVEFILFIGLLCYVVATVAYGLSMRRNAVLYGMRRMLFTDIAVGGVWVFIMAMLAIYLAYTHTI